MTETVSLRFLTKADAEHVYHWQSDRESRRFFTNKEVPDWKEHLAWIDKRIQLFPKLTYIIIQDKKNAGLLHLTPKNAGQLEVSILIAPESKGKGIAYAALRQAIELNTGETIVARVHEDNMASKKLFLKAGFMLCGDIYILENTKNGIESHSSKSVQEKT